MNVNSENNYIINLELYFGPVRYPYRRVLLIVSYTNRTWLVGFCCCFFFAVVWLPPWLLLPLLGRDRELTQEDSPATMRMNYEYSLRGQCLKMRLMKIRVHGLES